ncbi:MAG: tyrosine-type recombinase/integrase [Treponema sp.]|nr:tyrosine-type recombinase/integrase [Treponema sp.]
MKDKGNDVMNALINMTTDRETLTAIAAELAEFTDIDNPATWTPDIILQALRDAKNQRRADAMSKHIDIAGIDWQNEVFTFLNYTRSEHTRRAYAKAIADFESWAIRQGENRQGLNPLIATPADADRYIYYMKAETQKSPSTIRRDIAAISALYSFLERNTGKVKNPVRGTKQRPPKKNVKDVNIPTPEEYQAIIDNMPPVEKAIIIIMASRGLRIGALPTLERKQGGKYNGGSKGAELRGIMLPREALAAIKDAGLDMKRPFTWETRQRTVVNAAALETRINKHMRKLYQAGIIRTVFSAHDFRHYFTMSEYKKDKDIVRIKNLLGHSNISITDAYLQSLGLKE